MNGLGAARAISSGRYQGAIGRTHGGAQLSSRGSDFAMMRRLGMTPAGVGGLGFGDAAGDAALCRTLATVGTQVLNAVMQGVRPQGDSEQARRDQADYDRITGMVGSSAQAAVNFCNLLNQAQGQSTPGAGPSAWEIEQARRRLEQAQNARSKKTWQTVAMVGGGAAAIAAVWYLLK